MVTIMPNAAEKLKELIAEENKETQIPQTAGLRLYIQGGGCSGFQYGLMLEKEEGQNDQVFESNGIKIFIDPISIRYLEGAQVELVESPTGGGFTIKNPNATSTCGCGQSFSTE